MPKVYKWLAICIRSPYKNLGHFRKFLAIYFSKAKQNTEKKKKQKNKRRTYLASGPTSRTWPSSSPAQPRGGTCVFFRPPGRPAGRRWAPWARQAAAGRSE